MITVDTVPAIAKLDALADRLRSAARTAVEDSGGRLLLLVQEKLSGEALNLRSGALFRSIRTETVQSARGIEARVFSDGSAPYARIQEYGGRLNIPATTAVHAKALTFAYDGRLVFAKRTAAHVVDIPERSYLRSSLNEFETSFSQSMRETISDAVA